MKGTLRYQTEARTAEREVNYIPVRFIPAIALAVFCTEIACVIRIIASEDNPDCKIPWLLLVLVVPVAGFMLYFLFYDRKLHKRYIKRLEHLKPSASSQRTALCLRS